MPPSARVCRKRGFSVVLLLERDLEMMARHGLVIHERAQAELRHVRGPQRHLEDAGREPSSGGAL